MGDFILRAWDALHTGFGHSAVRAQWVAHQHNYSSLRSSLIASQQRKSEEETGE